MVFWRFRFKEETEAHDELNLILYAREKLLREKYQVFVQNPDNNKTLNYMNFMKDKNHQAFANTTFRSMEYKCLISSHFFWS